ncbi:MAG: hypothetical protein GY853_07005 [PVC group bacterium]|nr:hypothetical protein [PVC group bacterium]
MLACYFLKKKLYEYVEGELTSQEKKEIGRHLTDCAGCRKRVAEIKKIINAVEKKEKLFLNEDFWRKFDERLDVQKSAKTPIYKRLVLSGDFYRTRVALATAICIILMLIGINNYLPQPVSIDEQALVDTSILLDEMEELCLNHDEEGYIDEIILQIELEQV